MALYYVDYDFTTMSFSACVLIHEGEVIGFIPDDDGFYGWLHSWMLSVTCHELFLAGKITHAVSMPVDVLFHAEYFEGSTTPPEVFKKAMSEATRLTGNEPFMSKKVVFLNRLSQPRLL